MIPIMVRVRNFMPYRDNVPPLNFTGIHTASIWGENGNGKSALIEAMTWALWGQTRAKSDDDLVHQGQNEMEVEFEFSVGPDTYRIIRKHTKPRKQRGSGQSSLDLFISDNGVFKPITGNKISETEQNIKDILRMDYKTFINSAYLLQGHSDEFTIAKPAERKQVLSDILRLSLYDELEENAKELGRKQDFEKARAENTIKTITDELTRKPACEAELEKALGELKQTEGLILEGEARLKSLLRNKEIFEGKQRQMDQLNKHAADMQRMLDRENEQLKLHTSKITEYEELLSKRESIEEGYAQFIEAKKKNDEMNRRLAAVEKLNRRKYELNSIIQRAQAAIVTEHQVIENRISSLETEAGMLPRLRADYVKACTALSEIAAEEENLKQKRESEQKLRNYVHDLESDINRLQKEITETGEKLKVLASQQGAVCPLCGQALGEEHRRTIEAGYNSERAAKAADLKIRQTEILRKQAELKSASAEIPGIEAHVINMKTASQTRVNVLKRDIEKSEKAAVELEAAAAGFAEIQERLSKRDFAAVEQEILRRLDEESGKTEYSEQQHEQVRQSLNNLEKWEKPQQKLEEAVRRITEEKDAAEGGRQVSLELTASMENDRQTMETLRDELKSLPQLADELVKAETEQRSLNNRQKTAQELVGGLKSRLEHFDRLETALKENQAALNQASKEETIYRELTQAFSKKGIQAWLIEMALPEIEIEADKLLSRMTDNRMHIKIETQRLTKAGDTSETLDIKIADELGTRPYEQFSGGEAFRINFAIRIALSKLLARRAGAPLPTLIIDEGFGTQDAGGLEKLKEAIISIQDDFKMVLVITHVEELRDAFPTRIDVVKTADGSTIEVT
jgi:DNA repair protein SbcC/Rad50